MNKAIAVTIWIIGLAMLIVLPVFCDTGFAIRLGIAFAFSAHYMKVGNGLWGNEEGAKHNPPKEDEE